MCVCVCVCVCVAKPVAVELRCHATALIEFCTLQFCKCDISESIIGRGSKLL